MSTEGFTKEDVIHDTTGSFRALARYFREVPFHRRLFVPNAMFAALTAGAYQFFVWLVGRFAECQAGGPCADTMLFERFGLSVTLGTLVAVAAIVLVSRVVQWIVYEAIGQIASQGLFERMLRGVGQTRTTFFDEYPSGKIINRVVKDADQLRIYGPIRLGDSVTALMELLVITVVISLASPVAALVAIPALAAFLFIQRNVAPMLQRVLMLRSARFGEVLHRESDIIEGVRCFDLYGELPSLLSRFSQAAYRYMQMHFLRGHIEAWGRFWCDVAVAVYGAITLCAVFVAIHYGGLSTVLGVVIITAAFRLGGLFMWLSWSLGLLFETAGHAKRIFEYVDLPPEESEEGNTPGRGDVIPQTLEGDLSFESYSMSYRASTPPVLVNFSARIARGSKVGLVGRTGAGKTSIVQSLFRMVYVRGGDIRVGSQSLLELPIAEARKWFAIVPQDPYLFEGTVRSNLDRAREHDDATLRAALETVQLPLDLSMELREGGANLSLGQRQLLCLARVIISNKPFVIMDEPTSGVDTITDAVMQSVLRTALADRTILTIAHRLETLARMDRVIELRDGSIARDGTPEEILPLLSESELA